MTSTDNTSKQIKNIATRARKLIAKVRAGGFESLNECTDMLLKFNDYTLKLDRLGAITLAQEIESLKRGAREEGEENLRARRESELKAATERARAEKTEQEKIYGWIRK